MGYDWSQSPQPVMDSGDGMSTATGLAGQFIGLAVDDVRNSYWNSRQQEQYRENMQQQYYMGQEAQRNAARNHVAGLEAAGLSPVMAHSAAGASIGSSQMPTMPSLQHFSPLEVVQMRNIEAQTAKTEADTELVKASIPKTTAEITHTLADTQKIWTEIKDYEVKIQSGQISNAERIEYNNAIAKAMPSLVEMINDVPGLAESNPQLASWLQSMQSASNSGSLRALSDMVAEYGQDPGKFRQGVVDSFMLMNSSHELDLQLSKEQVDMLSKQIDQIVASTSKLMSDVEVNKSQIGLNKSQASLNQSNVALNASRQNEIDAHIKQMEASIREIEQLIKTSAADEKLKKQMTAASYYSASNQGQQAAAGDYKALATSQMQRLQAILGSLIGKLPTP